MGRLPVLLLGNPAIVVTATFSGAAYGQGMVVTPVFGPVNLSAPWDTNSSFPAKVNGFSTQVTASGLTTSSSNALLIAHIIQDGSWPLWSFFQSYSPVSPIWESVNGFVPLAQGVELIANARAAATSWGFRVYGSSVVFVSHE